ncbi:MAG: ribose 5-phosphate isomerase B [Candidatus Eremiobacteraeota bacterium]|nr:ribose 5-phosphate isomerase B [Candidatus Eremiobacteraeota bacterium]
MKIALSADHAGFGYKDQIAKALRERGHETHDFGTAGGTPVDYPDYGFVVGLAVARGGFDRGIVVCGSSIGIAIAANKVEGIRCASVTEPLSCELARRHNDANVLALSERLTGWEMIERLVEVFLETPFEGGPKSRHARRVAKLAFGEAEQRKAETDLARGRVEGAVTPKEFL